MHNLTSPSSPYAVADTPISIILITPAPIVPSLFGDVYDPATAWRVPEVHRQFHDAVVDVGREWKAKEQGEGNKTGWKVETLDLWEALVMDAGGEDDEALEKYYMCVDLFGQLEK